MRGSRRPLLSAIACLVLAGGVRADDRREELWAAVRGGEAAKVEEVLKKGAKVDATNEIGITALWLAASKGDLEVVKLLLKHGADVNTRDAIWYQTPLSYASALGQRELVKVLLQAGARGADEALLGAVARSQLPLVEVVLDNAKVRPETLSVALHLAPSGAKETAERLKKAGATELKKLTQEERDALKPYAGRYVNEHNTTLAVEVAEVGLVTRSLLRTSAVLTPAGKDAFRPLGVDGTTFRFERKGEKAQGVVMTRYTAEVSYYREDTKPVAKPVGAPAEAGDVRITAPAEWPSFRGEGASGVADGQHPPTTWDVKKEVNLRWKTPIPGMGHSCPVVWGDHVFVTTAISGDPNAKVRIGNYGDVDSVDDKTKHTWQVFCLDRETGKVRWKRTAFEGVPKIKRHLKGSQANCTPATDGKRVVACFGSEGLYCYDFEGRLVWKRDLGTLDSSFTIVKQYEWGFGSSPIVYDGLVILQCDLSKDSFIAAYSLEDGERVWTTPRDEIPSWSTPTVWRNGKRTEIVTNASQYARGYDPRTGKELWRLAKKSEATIPTPFGNRDLFFIASGNRPIQPIFALKPGATGDISLKEREKSNAHLAWSTMRGGPYMPTPILYGKYLYTCSNAGMITCYEAATGKQVYKERLGGVSYTASPVAADGRLYFTTEQGEVRVVRAGPTFELLAVNDMGDICMATPAISRGMLFVRSQHFLFALGRKPASSR